ncbi:unnamed protein product [Cercospora beticola]|nr:unnamed protein product [Cercospora beticola]
MRYDRHSMIWMQAQSSAGPEHSSCTADTALMQPQSLSFEAHMASRRCESKFSTPTDIVRPQHMAEEMQLDGCATSHEYPQSYPPSFLEHGYDTTALSQMDCARIYQTKRAGSEYSS